MKTILAYGDSLTFGYAPEGNGVRHAYEDRWPSVLEARLGGAARVIAEGLNGRTTAFDDHTAAADRNGVRVLPTLLDTHQPLDLVIIMLGSNDIKTFMTGSAFAAAAGMKRLGQIVRTYPYSHGGVPQVLLVAPPLLVPSPLNGPPALVSPRTEDDKLFGFYYERAAAELGAHFFDAATVAKADPRDGVHLDAANTRAIGEGLVPLVKQILGL
ncbi:SGNH/GDSL hydrolase family protein [Devosia sp.]|uniref:SGNH/GDSL hydrolase family protein n=1 Tax=Devosia sp. TaxID=1871048 RepID=UPI001AFF7E71|nr:SGNH/GDSL hydrolase family protein [Devosia sp.]MBO9587927.1 SGNH/GDSL hydrolase family protein [Devosia sp.]